MTNLVRIIWDWHDLPGCRPKWRHYHFDATLLFIDANGEVEATRVEIDGPQHFQEAYNRTLDRDKDNAVQKFCSLVRLHYNDIERSAKYVYEVRERGQGVWYSATYIDVFDIEDIQLRNRVILLE